MEERRKMLPHSCPHLPHSSSDILLTFNLLIAYEVGIDGWKNGHPMEWEVTMVRFPLDF